MRVSVVQLGEIVEVLDEATANEEGLAVAEISDRLLDEYANAYENFKQLGMELMNAFDDATDTVCDAQEQLALMPPIDGETI